MHFWECPKSISNRRYENKCITTLHTADLSCVKVTTGFSTAPSKRNGLPGRLAQGPAKRGAVASPTCQSAFQPGKKEAREVELKASWIGTMFI